MKKIILLLAVAISAAFSFTSCNRDSEFENNKMVWPKHLQLGAFQSDYPTGPDGADRFSYVITKNAVGDTVVNLVREEVAGAHKGLVATATTSEVIYADSCGLMVAVFETAGSWGVPVKLAVGYNRDGKTTSAQVIGKDRGGDFIIGSFKASPVKTPSVAGRWYVTSADSAVKMILQLNSVKEGGKGDAAVVVGKNKPEFVDYMFANGQLKVTSSAGDLTASFNKDYQLEGMINGKKVRLQRN